MAKICHFSRSNEPVETSLEIKPRKHRRGFSACRHCNFELDASTRTICCKECGEEVDPFDVLMEYALNQREFLQNVARNKAAIEEFERIQSEWSLTKMEKRRILHAR